MGSTGDGDLVVKMKGDTLQRILGLTAYYERSAVRQLMRLEEYLTSMTPAGLRAWVSRMRILTAERDGIIVPEDGYPVRATDTYDKLMDGEGIISLTNWTAYFRSTMFINFVQELRDTLTRIVATGSINTDFLTSSRVYELYAMQQAVDYFLYHNKHNEMDFWFFEEMRRKGLVKLTSVLGPELPVRRPTGPGCRLHIAPGFE